jgi:DNA excision repair protein ERCC-2
LKRELKISVRELVQLALRSGDLVFEFQGSNRPTDAIRAHQKIQKSRPDTYQPEVAISHQLETDRFILTISGRMDGVYSAPDRPLIEEIKTTSRALEHFEQHQSPLHWGQVKTYAYMYAVLHELDEIDAQLVYYQFDSGRMQEIKRTFALSELEVFVSQLVNHYLDWAETVVNWADVRKASIQALEFPYTAYRPGQRAMAVEVYRTIKNQGQLLNQAATGIGKTMAAVFPAVKAVGEELCSKIFYLTARTTGRTVAEKSLDDLRANGLKIKSLTLTAKDKICFNPDSACHPDECEYAKGHYDRIDEALKDIFQQDAFTRHIIIDAAQKHGVCPFEFSLELSLWADVIICDYNYAFDPRVFLRRFFQEEDGDYAFLIDEAHNLVDRSRDMFSAEIYKQPLLDVRRAIKTDLPHIFRCLGKINAQLVKARKECEVSGPSRAEKAPPEHLFPLLRQFLHLTERWLAQNIKTAYREVLLELYFAISGFLRVSDQYDDSYVTCYEKMNTDLKLKLFCIDPSQHLKQALNRCRSAIFFSATMTPMTYFKAILGCDDDADQLLIPSPFPKENLGIFVSDRISTLYRHRSRTKSEVLQPILSLIAQKKGNYLLFFPSYVYLQMIYELFLIQGPETKVIVQTPGMNESEREAFLECFSQDNPDTLVGFAVMGGIFGEGIDLVGRRLCGAVIVGVGLPAVCLEKELIRDYFTTTQQAGFEYAYLYPGINRVLQACGRVIRTENDRGVALLIDQRYSTYRYKSLLPAYWDPTRVSSEQQLADDLQQFWKH